MRNLTLKKAFLFTAFSLLFCATSFAQHITLPDLYDEGMTIQRGQSQTLHGITDPGMTTEIKWRGKTYKAEADRQGRFSLSIPAGEAGGPFVLQIGNRDIKNVYVGDVFLCSGQSNMELPMVRCEDLYRDVIDSYSNSQIHIVKTPRTYRLDEPNDIYSVKKNGASLWVEPKPENNGSIGAVTFFFAKKYNETYGVPVGIINSSVGGSPVEAWISEDSLIRFQESYNKILMAKDADYVKASQAFGAKSNQAWQKLAQKYWKEFDSQSPELKANNSKPVSLFSADWGRNSEGNINGLHYFQKTITLTKEQANEECMLRMGCIVDADEIFVNGEKVGGISYQYPPRKYKVRKGLLKEGENLIEIRLQSYGGTPTFVTEKPYKLYPLNTKFGEKPAWEIDLSAGWKYQLVQQMSGPQGGPDFMMTPAALYKGMLAPVLDWGYTGAVWYQGESNVGRANSYETMLKLLISDWRGRIAANQHAAPAKAKKGKKAPVSEASASELPFVIIQLANFLHPQSPDQAAQQALRDAQRKVAETTPKCDWVYTGDLGEWNDIHPLQKKEVGERVEAAFEKLLK